MKIKQMVCVEAPVCFELLSALAQKRSKDFVVKYRVYDNIFCKCRYAYNLCYICHPCFCLLFLYLFIFVIYYDE